MRETPGGEVRKAGEGSPSSGRELPAGEGTELQSPLAVLAPVQQGLCRLYRVPATLDVRDFVIDDLTRKRMGVHRAPREQLVVLQPAAAQHGERKPDEGDPDGEGDLGVGLFIDSHVLEMLLATPRHELTSQGRLGAFCMVVEGVSHFVYLVHRAQQDRTVTALELELQAEIDKFVTCVLETWDAPGGPPADLRERLYDRFELEEDLTPEERDRYLTARQHATTYARALEERYVRARALPDMLTELRRMFRLGYREKVEAIQRAA
jgi:hypothetical protein